LNRIFKEGQPLTVNEALNKHNMNLTFKDNLEAWYIHFIGYNKSKTIFLFIMFMVFILYLTTHKGSILFIGLLFALVKKF